MIAPVCQVCRREAGIKLVKVSKGTRRIWKCKSCLERKSVSFITIKDRRIF
jgi:ribosomal protein L37AE/L43A